MGHPEIGREKDEYNWYAENLRRTKKGIGTVTQSPLPRNGVAKVKCIFHCY